MYTYGRMQMEVLNLYQQYGGAGGAKAVGSGSRYGSVGEASAIKRGTAGGGGGAAVKPGGSGGGVGNDGIEGTSYSSRDWWFK